MTEKSRQELQEELNIYKDRLEGAMGAGNIAWWEMELPAGKVRFNERKARMLGYSPEKFKHYTDFTDLLHPDDYERTMSAMRNHLEGKKEKYEVEYRIKKKDGSYKWFRDVGSITKQEGEYRKVAGIVIDIDVRKQQEKELKQANQKLVAHNQQLQALEQQLRTEVEVHKQTESELRKLTRAIEQSPATVVITDTEGNIEYANPRFTEVTGYEVSEVEGKNPRFLKSEKHTDEFYENLWATISDGRIWRGEFCNRKKNGDFYWEDASIAPVFQGGEITNYIKVGEDITARRRSRRNLEKINSCFINFTPVPLENIRHLIRLAGELLGGVCALYNRLEGGKLFTEVGWSLPPDFKRHDDPEGHICYDLIKSGSDQVLTLNNLQESDYKKTDPNVSKYGLQSYMGRAVRRSGEPVGNLCVVYDKNVGFDSEKRTIVELIASAIEIEEERRRILEELRRSNEDLKNFANIAAHDLKHPLRTVASYMELLDRRFSDELEEKAQSYIRRARNGAYHMKDLLDGLLRYSRVETSEAGLEELDINDIIEQVVFALESEIEENDAEIIYSDLPPVKGDSSLLGRLFQNLINNALTYRGPEPPRIEIYVQPAGDMWRFNVSDNGIGIEEQYQEKIFKIFQRLHSPDEIPGTGIGLAVCKKIVELHGGEIGVTSTPGEGTTFHFTLPKG